MATDPDSATLIRGGDTVGSIPSVVVTTQGAGVSGTPAGGVVTVQGVSGGTPQPVQGVGTAGSADTHVLTVQGIASATPIITTGSGTAGSAASGVATVQGIASMTPFLVNGTGTAGTPSAAVMSVQGEASMTPFLVKGTGTAGSADTAVSTVQGIASMTPFIIQGNGTAGSADTHVVTIQGIASGTPIPVSLSSGASDSTLPFGATSMSALGTDAAVAANTTDSTTAVATTIVVPVGKTGYIMGWTGSSAGLAKFELLSGATFSAAITAGNIACPIYTAPQNPCLQTLCPSPIAVAAGNFVYVRGTNRDKQAEDLNAQVFMYFI